MVDSGDEDGPRRRAATAHARQARLREEEPAASSSSLGRQTITSAQASTSADVAKQPKHSSFSFSAGEDCVRCKINLHGEPALTPAFRSDTLSAADLLKTVREKGVEMRKDVEAIVQDFQAASDKAKYCRIW